jgi:hypothetical protein
MQTGLADLYSITIRSPSLLKSLLFAHSSMRLRIQQVRYAASTRRRQATAFEDCAAAVLVVPDASSYAHRYSRRPGEHTQKTTILFLFPEKVATILYFLYRQQTNGLSDVGLIRDTLLAMIGDAHVSTHVGCWARVRSRVP